MPKFDPILEGIRAAGFPTVERLRRGIILDCIIHSFWLVANDPIFEKCWEDNTYMEDECQGERWATSFLPGGAVAVFYSNESPRKPYPDGSPPYDQSRYFQGMPEHLNPAKERALAFMLDLDFRAHGPNAVVTAAMWADGERFTSFEPWDDVFDNTGWACADQLVSPEIALAHGWQGTDLPSNGIEVSRSLYDRRIASTEAVISVEMWELQAYLEAAGGDPDLGNYAAAQELLAGIGIALPGVV